MFSFFILVAFFAFFEASNAHAQADRKLSATPKAFQTFYTKFQAAVAKRDKNAVAAMTAFPFKYGWDAGDEGTYTKSQFIRNYGRIVDGSRRFLTRRNPTFSIENGNYYLMNEDDASSYGFRKRGSSYKFVSLVVLP